MQLKSGTLITTRAILFDMDGTLIDSTVAVENIWKHWANKHNIPFNQFAHRFHGRRAIDTLREVAPPRLDLEKEIQEIDAGELNETDGIVPIKGASELLASLPRNRWALVTSARPELAQVRMATAGLPMPEIVVASTDVNQGKPNPACYQLAMKRFGLNADQVLVFEDALAGLAAGHAAG